MFQIIFAPQERFATLKEKPQWLLPVILAILLPPLITTLGMVVYPRQGLITATEDRTERARRLVESRLEQTGNISEEQRAQFLQSMEERTQVEINLLRNSSIPKLLGIFLLRNIPAAAWSIVLLLLWSVVLNFLLPMFGTGGWFRRTFAVTANAALIRPVAALFRTGVMLASQNLLFRTNMLLILPSKVPPFARAFGSCVDIFVLWEVTLVAIGLQTVHNLELNKSFVATFGTWLVYALLLGGVMSALGIAAFL